jgi:hypothetical protein
VKDGGLIDRGMAPGDVLGMGESLVNGALATVGAGTWTGALIANAIINRSGPIGGYTDTTDTGNNIIASLGGAWNYNPLSPDPLKPWAAFANLDALAGSSFRLLVVNTVAFLLTWAAGASGIETGSGTLNIAASLWREYLVTVKNATPQQTFNAVTTNASAVVTFANPSTQPVGAITPGMQVSGAGITAGTLILGVTHTIGYLSGLTLSANATLTSVATGVALTFSPNVRFDGLRSGTL